MSDTWLLLDANNLLRRAWYALKRMDNDRADSMLFGFFRDVQTLRRHFGTDLVACAFDSDSSKRKELLADYKIGRQEKYNALTPAEQAEEDQRRSKTKFLRKRLLPQLGIPAWFSEGYEADDLIAAAVKHVGNEGLDFVVVSTDQDLYQLLSERVQIWSPGMGTLKPGRLITAKVFADEYGLEPRQWAKVKAIAGCVSDDVPGIRGVGEVKAIQYLKREMPRHHKAYQEIKNNREFLNENLKLVKLPLQGCPAFSLTWYQFDTSLWNTTMKGLEFSSLVEGF